MMIFLKKQVLAVFIFTAVLTVLSGCSAPQANNSISGNTVVASPQVELFNDSGLEELANDTGFEQEISTQGISPDDFEPDDSFEDDLAEIESMSQELENDLADIENMAFEMSETEQQADELETPDEKDFE